MKYKFLSLFLLVGIFVWYHFSLLYAESVQNDILQDQEFTLIDSGQRLPRLVDTEVAFGDLDGDGDLDYFESNRIWFNDGNGIFIDSGKSVEGDFGFVYDIALSDLNGDQHLDVLFATFKHNLIFFNDGLANFSSSGQIIEMAEGFTDATAFGDLDGDGDIDAYFGNRDYSENPDEVWLNNGSGIFTDTQQRLGLETSASVALRDVDSDQDLDAIVTTCGNFNEPDRVWLNDGSGNFSGSGQDFDYACTVDLGILDLNGDKHLDLVINNAGSDTGLFTIWLNDGTGQFSKSATIAGYRQGLKTGDIDGDQDVDVLLTQGTLMLNNGNGEFVQSTQTLPHNISRVIDLDGDSDLDLFITTATERQIWFNFRPSELSYAFFPTIHR